MTDKEFEKLLAASSLGTPAARRKIAWAEREYGLEGAARRIEEANRPQPSITCPECGMTSYNVHDIDQGYCGNCNDWTSPPAGVR